MTASPPPAPLFVNGWSIFPHSAFMEQLLDLVRQVQALKDNPSRTNVRDGRLMCRASTLSLFQRMDCGAVRKCLAVTDRSITLVKAARRPASTC